MKKPVVLITTNLRWIATSRIATAFANAGCHIEALCPPSHPLYRTHIVKRFHPYSTFRPLKHLRNAISSAAPDLLLPGDDLARHRLHDLHTIQRALDNSGICELIERSLGPADSFPILSARASAMKLARAEGVRVPDTEVLTKLADLDYFISRKGLPVVLKSDTSFGGNGVRIINSSHQAEEAFGALQGPPSLARALKRAAFSQDRSQVMLALFRERSPLNAQAFIYGREATTLVACWQGQVLAGLNFEVLEKRHALGPATVLRLLDNKEMSAATQSVIGRLRLSGLVGFDFMLEKHTGHAYLIEINARTTQVGHLTLGPGRDLPAALISALTGRTVPDSPALTERDTIALFPQESKLESASDYLRSAYYDLPRKEPQVVRTSFRTKLPA